MRRGMRNKITGNCGEEAACRYLKKNGYKILERNFRCTFGELDIIARTDKTLVFAEVKTRSSDAYGTPASAITYYKRCNIIRSAEMYLLKNPTELDIRFDVIEVYGGFDGGEFVGEGINHITDVFTDI